jgi:hypothetical protein
MSQQGLMSITATRIVAAQGVIVAPKGSSTDKLDGRSYHEETLFHSSTLESFTATRWGIKLTNTPCLDAKNRQAYHVQTTKAVLFIGLQAAHTRGV